MAWDQPSRSRDIRTTVGCEYFSSLMVLDDSRGRGSAMKVICNTDFLGKKLALVSRGVSPRSTIQILGGILLEAGEEVWGFQRWIWSCRSRPPRQRRSRSKEGW